MNLNDDKNLVILAVLIIAVCMVFVDVTPESKDIISNIVAGLFGLAVGKSLK